MADLGQIIPALGVGGAVSWTGNAVLQWVKSRADRQRIASDAEAQLGQHNDKFAMELLAAARLDLAAMRAEIAELRPLQAHLSRLEAHLGRLEVRLSHFEEALDNIEALLASADPEERKLAERRAALFVRRMGRLASDHDAASPQSGIGAALREVYRDTAAESPPPDQRDQLDRMS